MALGRSKILSTLLGRNACCSALLVRHKSVSSFQAKDTQVTLSSTRAPKPDPERLLFGHHFSDHMLEIEWSQDQGWSKPLISPLHNLQLHPASKVLHYAVELFEGMKAYRCVDGKVRMFRPRENMKRMLRTAIRTSLPEFEMEELLKCIKQLLRVDEDWVPHSTTSSLYIRPTFIGTEPTLGVSRSNRALLFVLVGPVGPYYPTGLKPVTLLADPSHVRAWPGGCGAYKMGANYAPTIRVQEVAASTRGCQQVLWLFGKEHQLTEVGTMNLFMFWINEQGEKELVTAPLDGLILPGVTRLSLLELARKWGEFKVSERPWHMAEVLKGLKENRVKEIFGAGTACVVSPVERILYMDQTLEIPTMEGEIAQRFLKELTDIHYGRTPSPWMEEIEE